MVSAFSMPFLTDINKLKGKKGESNYDNDKYRNVE